MLLDYLSKSKVQKLFLLCKRKSKIVPEKEKKGRGGNRYYALTAKQEALCVAYVKGGAKDKSAAYRDVYDCSRMKPETVNHLAHREFDKPKIRARVEELMAPAIKKAEVTAERVIAEYAKLAFTDLPGIVTFDGTSMSVADFDKLTPEQRACIKKFRVKTETKMQPDGEKVPVDVVEVELHSKQAALDSLAKHLGMFVERKILQNPDGTGVYPAIVILPSKDPDPE